MSAIEGYIPDTNFPRVATARDGSHIVVARCFGTFTEDQLFVAHRGDPKGSIAFINTDLIPRGRTPNDAFNSMDGSLWSRICSMLAPDPESVATVAGRFYVVRGTGVLPINLNARQDMTLAALKAEVTNRGLLFDAQRLQMLGELVLSPYRHPWEKGFSLGLNSGA